MAAIPSKPAAATVNGANKLPPTKISDPVKLWTMDHTPSNQFSTVTDLKIKIEGRIYIPVIQ